MDGAHICGVQEVEAGAVSIDPPEWANATGQGVDVEAGHGSWGQALVDVRFDSRLAAAELPRDLRRGVAFGVELLGSLLFFFGGLVVEGVVGVCGTGVGCGGHGDSRLTGL